MNIEKILQGRTIIKVESSDFDYGMKLTLDNGVMLTISSGEWLGSSVLRYVLKETSDTNLHPDQ